MLFIQNSSVFNSVLCKGSFVHDGIYANKWHCSVLQKYWNEQWNNVKSRTCPVTRVTLKDKAVVNRNIYPNS